MYKIPPCSCYSHACFPVAATSPCSVRFRTFTYPDFATFPSDFSTAPKPGLDNLFSNGERSLPTTQKQQMRSSFFHKKTHIAVSFFLQVGFCFSCYALMCFMFGVYQAHVQDGTMCRHISLVSAPHCGSCQLFSFDGDLIEPIAEKRASSFQLWL